MRRRTLLATLAAGSAVLAGCESSDGRGTTTGLPTDDDPPTTQQTTTHDPTPTTPEEPETPVEIGPAEDSIGAEFHTVMELENVPRTYALNSMMGSVGDTGEFELQFDRTGTDDYPAKLTGWLQNESDSEAVVEIADIPFVGNLHSQPPDGFGQPARLHAAPTANNDIAETVPTVRRTEDGLWYVSTMDLESGPWMPDTVRLGAGETVTLEYVLVGEAGTPGRPEGTYDFSTASESGTVIVWNSDSPGPEVDSRFGDRSVPMLDDELTVGWFHEAEQETQVFVRPSIERLELDGEIDFELVNHSPEALGCGHWNFYRLEDDQWTHVAPQAHTADCRFLTPGGQIDWTLAARSDNGDADDERSRSDGLTVDNLDSGTYAVVVGYGYPHDRSAALIELVGGA